MSRHARARENRERTQPGRLADGGRGSGKKRRRKMKLNRSITAALFGALAITLGLAVAVPAQITTTAKSPAFPVGLGPEGVVTDGANVYVANQFSDTVTKLRMSDGVAVGTFAAGHRPVAVAFDGAFLWVANYLSNNVMKLDPSGAVVGTYAVGDGPGGLLVTNGSVWVANRDSNTVTKLRGSDGLTLGTFEVGTRPIAMATDGEHIY